MYKSFDGITSYVKIVLHLGGSLRGEQDPDSSPLEVEVRPT